ncbi:MAG: helix-turn-helix domain-containing protein [Solirubrobacterales bacterium]
MFREDPELAGDTSPETLALLSEVRVDVVVAEQRSWEPSAQLRQRASLGLLVLEGVLVRTVHVLETFAVELIGRGDLILDPARIETYGSIPQRSTFEVLVPARVAVLDEPFRQESAGWCELDVQLATRTARRHTAAMARLAAARLPNATQRLLIVLWELADRWGRRSNGKVVIELPLTQALLAALSSVRREQVSRKAMPELVERGLVARREDGLYELRGDAPKG